MTDKAPAIGDQVPMPADEQVARHIARFSGRSNVEPTVPLTKEMLDEKHKAKPADSRDVVVVDPNAEPAPAGYDKQGQPLKKADAAAPKAAVATTNCQRCSHSTTEHPGGKACTHTTATLECDCAAFVAPS